MSHSKQWRQPEPTQLQCEKDLANYLIALIVSGDIKDRAVSYSQVDHESASSAIAPFLEKAQTLGHGYGQQQLARLERSIGTLTGGSIAQKLMGRARNLIDRALAWAKDLFASKVEQLGDASEEAIEQALEDTAETVADTLAPTEIVDVIEQEVMDVLQEAGIGQVEWITEPGACDICLENGDQGPITIGGIFPGGVERPPQHHRCRCSLSPV